MASYEEIEIIPVTVRYTIRKWGDRYDWVNEYGDEANVFFDSAEDARRDFL